jgi:hypothetical protein
MRGRRRIAAELPSTTAWLIESETIGHTIAETATYLAAVADREDEQARLLHEPGFVIATPEPFWRRWRWTW